MKYLTFTCFMFSYYRRELVDYKYELAGPGTQCACSFKLQGDEKLYEVKE